MNEMKFLMWVEEFGDFYEFVDKEFEYNLDEEYWLIV